MRLLLDEGVPEELARQLRAKGHDIAMVAERPDLRGAGDAQVFAAAQQERRSLLTTDAADFLELSQEARRQRNEHYGLVLAPLDRLVGDGSTLTALVHELGELFAQQPGGPSGLIHSLGGGR